MISPATARAFERIASRQADLREAFTPGATPRNGDVARDPSSAFTADSLSVTAPPESYFVGTDERGRQIYTRDGAFALHGDVLADRHGRPVLGVTVAGGALTQLRVDPVDRALGRTADLAIGSDGTVSYSRATIDPRTGAGEPGRVVIGRLALARFAPATKLQPLDATRFAAPGGAIPHLGNASDGNFGEIVPHRAEGSRVDFDRGIERLQEAYLAFDALRAAHHAQGGVEKAAMDLVK